MSTGKACRYSVIKYEPDSIREESINVGVVAWDSSEIVCRVTDNLSRAARLDPERIEYFGDCLKEFQEFCQGYKGLDFWAEASWRWNRLLVLTSPRGSLTPPSECAEKLFSVFVVEESK